MSLSAPAQDVVTRIAAKRATGDISHDPETDRLILLAELVSKLDSGAIGGGGTLTPEFVGNFGNRVLTPDDTGKVFIVASEDPDTFTWDEAQNLPVGFICQITNQGFYNPQLVLSGSLELVTSRTTNYVYHGETVTLHVVYPGIALLYGGVTNGQSWLWDFTKALTVITARTALGLGSVATESTVPVAKGGTGAATAAAGAAALVNGNPIAPSTVAMTTGTFSGTFTCSATGTAAPTFRTANGYGFGQDHINTGMTIGNSGGAALWVRSGVLVSMAQSGIFGFAGGGGWSGNIEVAIARNANGVLEINSGTLGVYRDLNLRNLCAFGGILKVATFTVGTLPSAASSSFGAVGVTDALSPAIGATVASGGSAKCVVRSDGTNWKVTEIL